MSSIQFFSALDQSNVQRKERQKSQILKALQKMQENFPKGAVIKGRLWRESNTFEGRLRVSSQTGVFFARARSQSLLSLVSKLQSKLVKQLFKWKDSRLAKRERRQRILG